MPIRQTDIESIRQRLSDAMASTQPDRTAGGLLSISLDAYAFTLAALPRLDDRWFYWGQPHQSTYLLGLGEALRVSASGDDRLEYLAASHQNWSQRQQHLDPDQTAAKPITVCGFAFNGNDPMKEAWRGWPNAAIFFPELLLQQRGKQGILTFTCLSEKWQQALGRWTRLLNTLASAINQPIHESRKATSIRRTLTQPTDQEWTEQINQARAHMQGGKLHKVVPFRRISIKAEDMLDPAQLMANLNRHYGNSIHFSARLNGLTFAAVTPERLIARSGTSIDCDAIGGTTRRSQQKEMDNALGFSLLNDPKCRHEHALVVENIRHALHPLCDELKYPERPDLIKLPNVQHLWSEFNGRLKEPRHLLQLAGRLHPTAAVNGYPSADANAWLNQHTTSQRGWYSGAAGWVDSEGNGELAVLLRCALLNGSNAELFAGAGITEASIPSVELQETELKFNTMLQALKHAAY